jgi:Tol biopolymer transport system component
MWLQGWTPDGRELLVLQTNMEEIGNLGFLNPDTARFRQIARAQGAAHARLSPDGSQIVLSELSADDPTQSDIKLIDCATGSTRDSSGPRRRLFAGLAPRWLPVVLALALPAARRPTEGDR